MPLVLLTAAELTLPLAVLDLEALPPDDVPRPPLAVTGFIIPMELIITRMKTIRILIGIPGGFIISIIFLSINYA
jgi:hypothetical protein